MLAESTGQKFNTLMSNLGNIYNMDWDSLLFVGMGNRIKSDDGAGIYITQQLRKLGIKNIVIAENGIENYIGKINRKEPKSIVLIDAMDMGKKQPGFYQLVPVKNLMNTTTNTHNLSLSTISSFLNIANPWVLGIQPENVSFGLELSDKVKSAADKIVRLLIECYNSNQIKRKI